MSEQLLYLPKVLLNTRPAARAELDGSLAAPGLKGEVLFYPFQGGSLLVAAANGLPEGFHGFHIHETGACTPRIGGKRFQ